MKGLFDSLFMLLVFGGCCYGLYAHFNKPDNQIPEIQARYSGEADYSIFDEDTDSTHADGCNRHMDSAVRQSCIDANTNQ